MDTKKTFENYPLRTVIRSNAVSIAIYALGFFIISGIGFTFSFLYLLYIFALEYRLLKKHCINCYYYGKTCGFGRGRLSAWFFQKGNISRFCNKKMGWKDMIPDILVSLIPFLVGIILLILDFNFMVLSTTALLFLLTTLGNGYIRSKLTCQYCKQRKLGCPAEELFNKGQ